MNTISFTNRETVSYRNWKRNVFFICGIAVIIINFLLLFLGGLNSGNIGSAMFLASLVFVCSFIQPAYVKKKENVLEELQQTASGICITIPKINRGSGYQKEIIEWPKEQVTDLTFYADERKIEIIGKPIFQIESASQKRILHALMEYKFIIHCTEDNKEAILRALQSGLQRIAKKI